MTSRHAITVAVDFRQFYLWDGGIDPLPFADDYTDLWDGANGGDSPTWLDGRVPMMAEHYHQRCQAGGIRCAVFDDDAGTYSAPETPTFYTTEDKTLREVLGVPSSDVDASDSTRPYC